MPKPVADDRNHGTRPAVRRRRHLGMILLAGLVLAGVAWSTGWLPGLLLFDIAPRFLPLAVGRNFEITGIGRDGPPPLPEHGAALSISAGQLREIVNDALPAARFLVPSNLIGHGAYIAGYWLPDEEDVPLPDQGRLPLVFAVNDHAGTRPRIRVRFPAAYLNEMLRDESFVRASRERDWFLGSYDLEYRLLVDSLEARSAHAEPDMGRDDRRLRFTARGKGRLAFDDDLLHARTTGRVGALDGRVDVRLVHDRQGTGFTYQIVIEKLKVNVGNLAPWGDRKVSSELQDSLTRSLNRKRKQERLADVRIPAWIPTDLVVDARLTP